MKLPREHGRDEMPHRVRLRKAVQQQQRRAVAAAAHVQPRRTGIDLAEREARVERMAPPVPPAAPRQDWEATASFDLDATRLNRRVDWEYNGNWKFQNDNWETYHHVWVHEGIFEKMSDDLDMETRQPRMATLQWENVVTLQSPKGSNRLPFDVAGLPPVPRMLGEHKYGGGTSLVFPNVTITALDNHLASVITLPVAPGKTKAILGFFFTGDAAISEEMEDHRGPILDRWLGPSRDRYGNDGIRSQDFRIWEGQQIARQSKVADDVKFSPIWEQNIHHFHNQMINALI